MIGRKKNNRISIALVSASIVLALLFTGFGYPGFMIPLIRKEQPEPIVHTADQLLNSISDIEPEEIANVLPAGNSEAFSIEAQPGVIISAEENALDQDRDFTLTLCSEEEKEEYNALLEENDCGMQLLELWELDAGLDDDESFPGTYHVDIDLEEIGIFEENYDRVRAYRIDDSGKWYEYAASVEDGHLEFDSAQNSFLGLTLVAGFSWKLTAGIIALGTATGVVLVNEKGSQEWLWGFKSISCYEKDLGSSDATDLGKKLYNIRIKYPQAIEAATTKLSDTYRSVAYKHNEEVKKNATDMTIALCGNNPDLPVYSVYYEQFKEKERDRLVRADPVYQSAELEYNNAISNSGIDISYIKTFGSYCIKANQYLKDVAKVKTPDQRDYVVDIYLKYDYGQPGVTVSTIPFGNCYVVIKGKEIMDGHDTEGETFTTLIHELLHVSQREYRGKLRAYMKFDEATAQLIEFKAKKHFDEIKKVNKENPNRWQTYFVPLDSSSTYIDGVSQTPKLMDKGKTETLGSGELGYPLCHFIDYCIKNYKSAMTFGGLFSSYETNGSFTDTLKGAFGWSDKELTEAYKKFIKANQTNFYELARQWYTGENAGNQWALSRKGFAKQGEHAVIKNQAYQTTVRKIYPQAPPDGRQKQVSVLLAYDDNYKELKDFELIPIGNKNYKNTKYGIMYDPKPYSTMKDLFTLEIDGGANTEDVTSGYTVWTLFAPKPIGDIKLKDGMINFQLPEKSDAAKDGKIDGYRVTITCTTDGTKSEKFYKISGAGKDISLSAKNYKDKETKIEDAQFRVSVCEYIKEATGEKAFGPESDPSNSIVDDMEDTLEQMGAGHGKVNISLGWKTSDDLDLHVVTPNGGEIY